MTNTPAVITLFRTVALQLPAPDSIRLDDVQAETAIVLGLAPLLHMAVDDVEDLLPASYSLPVACAALAAKNTTDRQTAALHGILDMAPGVSDHVTLLKGIDTRDRYPARRLRRMGDIDLLVDADDLRGFEEGLLRLGYELEALRMPERFYTDHHHSRPFVHPETDVRVEVHRELAGPNTQLGMVPAFETESVLSHRFLSECDGRPVYRLGPELSLVYTASHWCYDLRIPLVCNGLLDFVVTLQNPEHDIDWNLIAGWLDDQRVATALYVMLTYLEKHELAEIDAGFRPALLDAKKSVGPLSLRVLHSIIDACLEGRMWSRMDFLGSSTVVWRTITCSRGPAWNAFRVPLSLLFRGSDGLLSIGSQRLTPRSKAPMLGEH